ncbi:MAG: hypothetical protein ACI8X5_000494 [Planctomycetota bacterium]|jgi:hypothetical protein
MSMKTLNYALRAAATLSLTSAVFGQVSLFDLMGEALGDRFGSAVAGVGDVDGDLVPDWAASSPFSNTNGSMSGSVRIFSGATGNTLMSFTGAAAGDLFGYSVAGGDLNGDGRSDIIIGAYGSDSGGTDAGTVYAFSGLDESLIFSQDGSSAGDSLGFAVSFIRDVNGDGKGDVLAGAWTADSNGMNNNGEVVLLRGTNGVQMDKWVGENPFDFFGYSVAGLDDVDGDGFGDLVVGAPGNGVNGSGAGSAYVYSGATGALIHSMLGDAAGDGFGSAVADGGDVDIDNSSDIFVGAPGSDLNAANAGLARIFSGTTGATLYSFTGDGIGDNFGGAVAGNFDVTADNITDLFVGAANADPNGTSSGLVRVLSGADGSTFVTLEGQTAGGRYGSAVANGGDTNFDNQGELLIGAFGESAGIGAFTGEVHALTFATEPVYTQSYCMSLDNSGGGSALMSSTGTTSVASNRFVLSCSGSVPNTPGLFFYGQSELQVPFGDGFRCVGGQIFRTNAIVSDSFGLAQTSIDFGNPMVAEGQITGGSVWKFQFWFRDTPANASGFNLSDGLSVTFLP